MKQHTLFKHFTSYYGLCEFLKRFNKEYYDKLEIQTTTHPILSRRLGGLVNDSNIIQVTPEQHFKLHALMGIESKCRQVKWRQFKEAAKILGIAETKQAVLGVLYTLNVADEYHF